MIYYRKQLISHLDLKFMSKTILSKCNSLITNTEFPFKKNALSTRKVFTDLLAYINHRSHEDQKKQKQNLRFVGDSGENSRSNENLDTLPQNNGSLEQTSFLNFGQQNTMSPKGVFFESVGDNSLQTVQSEAKFILPSIRGTAGANTNQSLVLNNPKLTSWKNDKHQNLKD
jgi:hypothetical protein